MTFGTGFPYIDFRRNNLIRIVYFTLKMFCKCFTRYFDCYFALDVISLVDAQYYNPRFIIIYVKYLFEFTLDDTRETRVISSQTRAIGLTSLRHLGW